MFNWITSWWTNGLLSGPARNAPNDGVGIKELIAQKPPQVVSVTDSDLKQAIDNLKKAEINLISFVSDKPPVLLELHKVFGTGNKDFFSVIKQKRIAKLQAKLDQLIKEENTI